MTCLLTQRIAAKHNFSLNRISSRLGDRRVPVGNSCRKGTTGLPGGNNATFWTDAQWRWLFQAVFVPPVHGCPAVGDGRHCTHWRGGAWECCQCPGVWLAC